MCQDSKTTSRLCQDLRKNIKIILIFKDNIKIILGFKRSNPNHKKKFKHGILNMRNKEINLKEKGKKKTHLG